jgi:ABC-type nitrate/sulfonate/bicarbonate transport system substrate-binding protein
MCHRICAAALLGALIAPMVWAQPRQKVTIIYPTRASQTWPLYIAKEGGYYAKYGFEVDLQFGVHPTAIAAITSGQALMSPYTLEQSMQASFRDGSFIMLGQPYKKSSFALVASKDIKTVAALRGKRIAVSQLADAPYNYAVGLLARAKLTPRDVQWVPVGAGAGARAAAVASGRADATMLTAPEYFKLEAEGYSILANIADAEEIYAPSVYLFKKSAVANNDIAERMIKAHAEATKRFYDDKKFAVDVYVKWDPSQSRADIERVWDIYSAMGAYERVPYVLAPAVKYVLDHPADAQSAAAMRAYDWRQVIDNRIVDKLVKEGFFEKLFGPAVKPEQEAKQRQAFR